MSKKTSSDEIDLLEVILVVWKRKWIVISITVLVLVSTIVFQISNKSPSTSLIKTEIKPISVYDEAEYRVYNSVINKLDNSLTALVKKKRFQSFDSDRNIVDTLIVDNFLINNINRVVLYDLFVERIKKKSNLEDAIKKFNFLDKTDYKNNFEYESAVKNLVSSDIKFSSTKKQFSISIEYETLNEEKWINFLEFIEKEINTQIQERLAKLFENYLKYENNIKEYEIEDINTKLSFVINNEEKEFLNNKKNILIASQFSERSKNIFLASPVSKPEEFYAARIIFENSSYEYGKTRSIKFLYFMSCLSGLILGIFFVLIMNAIQKRR